MPLKYLWRPDSPSETPEDSAPCLRPNSDGWEFSLLAAHPSRITRPPHHSENTWDFSAFHSIAQLWLITNGFPVPTVNRSGV